MRKSPCSHHFCNSACQNDDEVSDDHPHPCISSPCSPGSVHGSKIPRAIKAPISPVTENNKSNNIETKVPTIIVMAPSVLTESEILAIGLNYIGFPFKVQPRTRESI